VWLFCVVCSGQSNLYPVAGNQIASRYQQEYTNNIQLCQSCFAGSSVVGASPPIGTTNVGTALITGCLTTCNAGYQFGTNICEVCPVGTWKGTSGAAGTVSCTACTNAKTTDPNVIATQLPISSSSCICGQGKRLVSGSCANCLANTFKNTWGDALTCSSCAEYGNKTRSTSTYKLKHAHESTCIIPT
jgi:hypothetical protein